jgi:hypothetical protein
MIADALHTSAWGESSDNWQIWNMIIDWDCQYMSIGPQEAWITYFKIEKVDENNARFESRMIVQPRRIAISIDKYEHYPFYRDIDGIDIDELTISISEAVEIAEKNGGKKVRESVENECSVSVFIRSDPMSYNGWEIHYDMEDYSNNFSIYINPNTGDVEEIR